MSSSNEAQRKMTRGYDCMTYTLVIMRNIIIKTLMSDDDHYLFGILPRRVINYLDCYVEMSRTSMS